MALISITIVDNPAIGPRGITVTVEGAPVFDPEGPADSLTFAQTLAAQIFKAVMKSTSNITTLTAARPGEGN